MADVHTDSEVVRVAALKALGVLDTPPEPEFDRIVLLAHSLFAAPIALVSLVDDRRQWFKARIGLGVCETPRKISFCTYAIRGDDIFEVTDATADPRFASNPLVTGEPHVRYYAGAPLIAGPHRLGTLCIIDHHARAPLTRQERELLKSLAAMVVSHLELRQLREVGEIAMAVSATSSDAIVCTDARGRIIHWNASAEALFGRAVFDTIGQDINVIVPERYRSVHDDGMSKLREGGKPTLVGKTVEVPALHADGRELPIELSLTMWRNSENRPAGFGAIIRDLSEKKAAELERRQSLERVTYLARHDTLTGLANRAHFAELLDESLAGGAPAVLCIDLDRFKAVNDLFGHATGDQLLRAVAVRLKQASDSDCRPGRLGGDEFAVIVPGPDAARRAERLAREVINRLSQPFMLDGRAGHIGASIGIAVSPTDGVEASSLLHNADLALYRAKAQGRGRLCFFEAEMDRAARERRALEADLRTALLNNEIELHYQPLASIDAGRVSGFEVLARWYHPEHGVIAPAHFIPIAEECGVIVEIGLHILRRAMQEAAGWSPLLNIAVNLSPLQVVHSDFASDVEALLKETGLAPERLELEITEGLLLRDTERALMILARLRALGVRISMDDFGTGYSSLSYFRQFPFDKVKIDQSFVREMTESRQALAIVQAIIGLGRGLGMPVVAEGVETRAQLDSLQAEGCAEVQGFFVGPPQPIEDYRHLVASKN